MRCCAAAFLLCAAAAAAGAPVPVVVELFTSEGCSSCPPADALLDRLERTQPVPGVEIIALEEHVDYWDRLGWRDPFSSAAFTSRQQDYAGPLRVDSVYTPQMIVAGRTQFVGGDAQRAAREIRNAAREPSLVASINARGALLSVRVGDAPAALRHTVYDVFLAITETNLASDVTRGENAGHTLRHAPVVRSLTRIGTFDARKSDSFSMEAPLRVDINWKRANLRAVVLVESRGSRRIAGAASVELAAPLTRASAR